VLPTVDVDGLAIYVLGEGEPVLLMPYPHAMSVLGRNDRTSRSLADGLRSLGRQFVSFDPPGSGHSSRPMRLGMAEMLSCSAEALAAAGVERAVDVVGHSQGAVAALAMAIECPEIVRRLVLIGVGAAGQSWMQAPGALWNRTHPAFWSCGLWGALLQAARVLAVEKMYLNRIVRASYADHRHAPRRKVRLGDWMRRANPRLQWAWIARKLDYRPRLHGVPAPTLVIAGRHDPQTPPSVNEEVARELPNGRLVLFEDSGHYPFLEEPARFWSEVDAFLSEESLRNMVA
jgi:pimeloyl-ACP methyl ester carboxylesterase